MTRASIVIVEDEVVVARDLKTTLEQLGYAVPGMASSADEAIALVREVCPDLVILDVVIRGKRNGIDVAGVVRHELGIPVIYLTAHSDEATLERAKATTPYGYIIKPFQERELHSNIEMALHRRAMEKRLDHVNAVLRAIRNVNQLITQEKDRGVLLERACENLVETRGFSTAWIGLRNDAGDLVPAAQAGLGDEWQRLNAWMAAGAIPCCYEHSCREKVAVISQPAANCGACPLATLEFPGGGPRGAMSVRLAHAGQEFGCLTVSAPQRYVDDEEEHDLLAEVAGDIGFALHSILAEEERRRVEAERARILDTSHDLICIAGTDGYFKYVNPAWQRLLGYNEEELLCRPFLDFIHPADHEKNNAEVNSLVRGQDTINFVNRYVHKDGSFKTISWRARSAGGEGLIYAFGRDITEQQAAEHSARESMELLQLAMESAHEGAWECDLRAGLIRLDAAASRMLGYEDVVPPKPIEWWLSRIHTEDRTGIRDAVANLRTGRSQRLEEEYRLERTDGSHAWVTSTARVIRVDADGAPDLVVGIHRDITDRKRAERALEHERARAQQYLDVAGVMLVALDADGRVTLLNPAGCQLLGYTPDEIVGRNWFEACIPVSQRQQVRQVFDQIVAGNLEPVEYYENDVIRRDGETRLFAWHNSVFYDDSGKLLGLVSSGEDVTEIRRAEAALRDSEERFRTITENSADAIFIADESGTYVYVNRAACELLGYASEELVGMSIRDVTEAPKDHFETLRRDGRFLRELNLVRKDGTSVPVELNAVILPDGRAYESCREITKRKQLEAQMAQSDRLASMGMLAAGVAHEINNPLSYVLYNLESLLAEFPLLLQAMQQCRTALTDHLDNEATAKVLGEDAATLNPIHLADVRARFRDALAGTKRIREIARGLGTFSRVESDDVSPVSLQNVIDAATSMAQNEIKYRARLVVDHGRVPLLKASDGRLSQVFLNLLVNAAHAIEEGDVDRNQIRVRTWSDGGLVYAEVKDTGSGIPPDKLNHVFEPFFSTKQHGVGSGLGLAISKSIVEGFGGTIGVESEVGVGTTFTVRLPVGDTAATTAAAPTQADDGLEVRGRVLIVDDEMALASAMKRVLHQHETIEAQSGAAAMRLLKEDQAFDVILCDMMMPEVSGMDLHTWLRAEHPELADRLIFVTGGAFTPRARDYLKSVSNLRLEKPIDAVNLKRIVCDYVRRREEVS